MSDKEIRDWENLAKAGDVDAALKWYYYHVRQGTVPFREQSNLNFEHIFNLPICVRTLWRLHTKDKFNSRANQWLQQNYDWPYGQLNAHQDPSENLQVYAKLSIDTKLPKTLIITLHFALAAPNESNLFFNKQFTLEFKSLEGLSYSDHEKWLWLCEEELNYLVQHTLSYIRNKSTLSKIQSLKQISKQNELVNSHNILRNLRQQVIDYEQKLAYQIIKYLSKS